MGKSSRIITKKRKTKNARNKKTKKELQTPHAYTYYCLQKRCKNKKENRHYHKIDENPRILCSQCRKPMVKGLSRKAGNIRVEFKGWWPDKRRKEINHRFKQQEVKAKKRNIDIEQLRGWAKRKSHKTVSPYLMDPAVDGKSSPHDSDPSTGHFHDELEM